MRVHLIKLKTIHDFVLTHANSEIHFKDWLTKIRYADWEFPIDINNTFNSADALGKGSR